MEVGAWIAVVAAHSSLSVSPGLRKYHADPGGVSTIHLAWIEFWEFFYHCSSAMKAEIFLSLMNPENDL